MDTKPILSKSQRADIQRAIVSVHRDMQILDRLEACDTDCSEERAIAALVVAKLEKQLKYLGDMHPLGEAATDAEINA